MSRSSAVKVEPPGAACRQGAGDHLDVLVINCSRPAWARPCPTRWASATSRSPAPSASSAWRTRCGAVARPRYRAPVYWFAVMMVAVFGTMVADGLQRRARPPLRRHDAVLRGDRRRVFWRWYRSEGTLSIHSIITRAPRDVLLGARCSRRSRSAPPPATSPRSAPPGFPRLGVPLRGLIAVPALAAGAGGSTRSSRSGRPTSSRARSAPRLPTGSASRTRRPAWPGGDATVALIALALFVVLVAYVAVTKNDIQETVAAHPHREHHQLAGAHIEGQPQVAET